MSTHASSTEQYWGYLIKNDKTPAPRFEQLLLGIAHYINRQVAPWGTQCLTPAKLATFYRIVGGNRDALFLENPPDALSSMYQSMGCYHTLQPDKNPYAPPSIPALTPQGFVRWQTVQLLLGPEEHVPYLQNAVKRLNLSNPADGKPFPTFLPPNALPSRPDPETLQWTQKVSDRLRPQGRGIPGTHPARALSDGTSERTLESSDDQSLVDAANHRPPFRHPSPLHMPYGNGPTSRRGTPRPWTPNRRRSNSDPQFQRPHSRERKPRRTDPRPHPRRRSPSTSSSSSYTSTSSSDVSDDLGRRHRASSSATLQPPHRTSSQRHDPQRAQSARQSPLPHTATFSNRPPSGSVPPLRNPSVSGRGNARGHSVRWGADSVRNITPGQERYRDRDGRSRAVSEERVSRRGRSERESGTGVGGRRYPYY